VATNTMRKRRSMAETKTIKAVELVRRIRDEQAATLAGKSDDEVLTVGLSRSERDTFLEQHYRQDHPWNTSPEPNRPL
jgi:hypothetical protein